MNKQLTLCLVRKNSNVLLGLKKRGFGNGLWNGFGGKVEPGETIIEAAVRELREEVSIEAEELSKVGQLEFVFESGSEPLDVHIFEVTRYSGEPVESEEMEPKWFTTKEIPFAQMWADDEFWFPYYLAGKKFKGRFLFDQPSSKEYMAKLLEQELHAVEQW